MAAAPSRMMESRRTTSSRGAVDAEAVGVASGLEAEGVVVDVDVGVGDEDVGGGVDVDAVGGGAASAFVVADGDVVDGDVGWE